MAIDETNLKNILLKGNYITAYNLSKAESYAKEHNTLFTQYFIEQKILNDDVIGKAIADSLAVPYSDLNSATISSEQVLSIPEQVAKKNRVVLFLQNDKDIVVATDNPKNPDLVSEVSKVFPRKKII